MVASELHAQAMQSVPPEQLLTSMVAALLTLHIACVSGVSAANIYCRISANMGFVQRLARVMEVEPLHVQLLAVRSLYRTDE